jgi:hypothetical protein
MRPTPLVNAKFPENIGIVHKTFHDNQPLMFAPFRYTPETEGEVGVVKSFEQIST